MHESRKATVKAGLLLLILSLLLTAIFLPAFAAAEETDMNDLTILFTSDIHSALAPHSAFIEGSGQHVGGFARLKSAIEANHVPDRTLLLDSGDFSMGSIYQSFCITDAPELTMMNQLGFDAAALGNHDFELTEKGLQQELDLLREKGGKVTILASNLIQGNGAASSLQDENPLNAHGVQNYTILERNGLRIGVFALMGYEAIQYTPLQTLSFADPIETAKATVRKLRAEEKVDLVILLAHCGTIPGTSFQEDTDIAMAVDGIDVILSGHAHAIIPELMYVNGSVIAGVGTALQALGKLQLNRTAEGWDYTYEVIYLTDEFPEDQAYKAQVDQYTQQVENHYLKTYGVLDNLDENVVYSPYNFIDGDNMCKAVENYPFAALLTDSYDYALNEVGITDVDVSIIPVGIVRAGIYQGPVSVIDIYNVLSYGISPLDGTSGAPIVTFYVTGRELYDICETSVSLSSIVTTTQMFFSGLRYTWSEGRPFLNRVYAVEIFDKESGAYQPVRRDNSSLYKIAISWTSAQNIALMKNNTYGLLSVAAKNADGSLIDVENDLKEHIVTYPVEGTATELKEWYALYSCLKAMPKNADGLPQIIEKYSQPASFMNKEALSFVTFFRNPSKAAWLMLLVILLVLALIVAIVFLLCAGFNKFILHRK